MKKPIISVFVAISLLTFSCGETTKDAPKETVKTEIVVNEIPSTSANYTASLEISGMTCAMGCAKYIENKLKNTEGIVSASVDFENNLASVEYDNGKIDENKMVGLITEIHDGQYQVNKMVISKPSGNIQTGSDSISTEATEQSSEEQISFNYSFKVPNILDALFKMVQF